MCSFFAPQTTKKRNILVINYSNTYCIIKDSKERVLYDSFNIKLSSILCIYMRWKDMCGGNGGGLYGYFLSVSTCWRCSRVDLLQLFLDQRVLSTDLFNGSLYWQVALSYGDQDFFLVSLSWKKENHNSYLTKFDWLGQLIALFAAVQVNDWIVIDLDLHTQWVQLLPWLALWICYW